MAKKKQSIGFYIGIITFLFFLLAAGVSMVWSMFIRNKQLRLDEATGSSQIVIKVGELCREYNDLYFIR